MAATLDVKVNPSGAIAGAKAVEGALERLRVKAGSLESSFVNMGRSSERLGLAFKALTASFAIGGLFKLSDAYTTVRNRLDLVSDSTADAAAKFQIIKKLANDTRAPLEETAKFFSQLTLNSKNLGLSFEETIGITKTLNQVIALTGQSTEASKNALIQLQQAFGSGALRGDELRSVMEQLPLLAQLIADKMGIAVGQLKDFAQKGLVSAQVVADALTASSEEIDKAFQKSRFTFSQAWTIMTNGIIQTIGKFDEATGAMQFFAKGIAAVGKNMETILTIAFNAATAVGAIWAVAKVAAFLTYLTSVQASLFTIQNGAIVTTATFTGMQLAVMRVRDAFVAAKVAALAFTYSNPFTAIAGAILTVLGLLWTFSDAIVLNTQTGMTLKHVFLGFFMWLGEALTAAITGFTTWFNSLNIQTTQVTMLFTTLWNILTTIFNLIMTVGMALYNTFAAVGIDAQLLLNVLTMVVTVINALVEAASFLVNYFFQAVGAIYAATESVTLFGNEATSAFDSIINGIDHLLKMFGGLAAVIVEALADPWELVAVMAEAAFQKIDEYLGGLLTSIGNAVEMFKDWFGVLGLGEGGAEVTVKGTITPDQYFNKMKQTYQQAYQSSGYKSATTDAVKAGINASEEKNWFRDLASKAATLVEEQKKTTNAVKTAKSDSSTITSNADKNAKVIEAAVNKTTAAVMDVGTRPVSVHVGNDGVFVKHEPAGTEPPSGSYPSIGGNVTDAMKSGGGKSNLINGGEPFSVSPVNTYGMWGGGPQFYGGANESKPIVDMTWDEVKASNIAAQEQAKFQANLQAASELLYLEITDGIAAGAIDVKNSASKYNEGMSLFERAFKDPSIVGKLEAAGEQFFSGIINYVDGLGLTGDEFLSSQKVNAVRGTQEQFGGTPMWGVRTGSLTSISKWGGKLDTEMVKVYDTIRMKMVEAWEAGENPFEFLAKYGGQLEELGLSTTDLINAFGDAAGGVVGAAEWLEREYKRLDLQRSNVSPLVYAGVTPNMQIDGYATGGDFQVMGKGGVDKNLISFMASRGESVSVKTKKQQRAEGGGSGTMQINVNVSFAGVTDMGSFRQNSAEIQGSIQRAIRSATRAGR